MYTGLLHTHSFFRYVVLLLLVLVVASLAVDRKKGFTHSHKQKLLWLTLSAHIQLLLGAALLFVSPYVQFSGETMKDRTLRYWSVEHTTMMILAVVMITLARIYSKKNLPDRTKYKRALWLTGGALVIVVAALATSGRGIIIPKG